MTFLENKTKQKNSLWLWTQSELLHWKRDMGEGRAEKHGGGEQGLRSRTRSDLAWLPQQGKDNYSTLVIWD